MFDGNDPGVALKSPRGVLPGDVNCMKGNMDLDGG